MDPVAGFKYFPLRFSENGDPVDPSEMEALSAAVHAQNNAEVILIAHGFRNNEDDATGLYTNFLKNFAVHRSGAFASKLANRNFIVGAVYWPSKPFREEEDSDGRAQSVGGDTADQQTILDKIDDLKTLATTSQQLADLEKAKALVGPAQTSSDAQDEFADRIRTLVQGQPSDPMEGDSKFVSMSGSEALQKLGAGPIIVPTTRSSDDDGSAQSLSFVPPTSSDDGAVEDFDAFFGSVLGYIGHFLNLTLWYVMKNRSGAVGANGVAAAVRKLSALQPAPKIHLVGHSLGGRLMASCVNSLAKDPVVHPDSVSLLEAAFSHYGFSEDNGYGETGTFRAVVTKHVVKGPFFCTYSVKDTVVGHVYALASRLADDNVRAIGDENDQFGGIGRNGAQRTPDVAMKTSLLRPGAGEYVFTPGKIWSLDGSADLILDHGDVTNPAVTYAFASAVSQT